MNNVNKDYLKTFHKGVIRGADQDESQARGDRGRHGQVGGVRNPA